MTAPQTGNDTRGRGSGPLNWLLDELVDKVGSIRKAVVLSGDGLPTGSSKDLTREDSEHLAAVASGFHSLAKGVGRHFDSGSVRQTVVELDEAFLFVMAAKRRKLPGRAGRRRIRCGPGRVRDDPHGQARRRPPGDRPALRAASRRVRRTA